MTADLQKRISFIQSKLSNLQGRHISLKKDELLYRQNDLSDSFYLLISGSVGSVHQNEERNSFTRQIKKDEFFGIDEILKNEHRPDTVIALEDSELLKIKIGTSLKAYPSEIYSELSRTAPLNDAFVSVTRSTSSANLYRIHDIRGKKIISFYSNRGNLNNAVFFKNIIFSSIDEGNINLIIDLSACRAIDSTFLGTLIASLKKISAKGGNLKLVCDENLCSWLFVMTKMDKVFEIYSSLEEAVES